MVLLSGRDKDEYTKPLGRKRDANGRELFRTPLHAEREWKISQEGDEGQNRKRQNNENEGRRINDDNDAVQSRNDSDSDDFLSPIGGRSKSKGEGLFRDPKHTEKDRIRAASDSLRFRNSTGLKEADLGLGILRKFLT